MVCIHSSKYPPSLLPPIPLSLSLSSYPFSLLGHFCSKHSITTNKVKGMALLEKHLLLLALLCAAAVLRDATGSRIQMGHHKYRKDYHSSSPEREDKARMLIGSVAPTCTYECRGCRYKCRAEQVPVEGNDPINSAYHYKCVCHR